MRRSRLAVVLLLALTAAACDSAPTASAPAAEAADISLTGGQTSSERAAPLLARLFRQAIAKVKADRGDAAAAQLSAEHRRLVEGARTARAAGDAATARARMREADAAAARVVSRVFPDAPRRVLAQVAEQLTKLNERIAAARANGDDVTRAREATQRIARLHAAATAELGNGRPAQAVLHATQAADLIAALRNR